jgi:hypothetical protein
MMLSCDYKVVGFKSGPADGGTLGPRPEYPVMARQVPDMPPGETMFAINI